MQVYRNQFVSEELNPHASGMKKVTGAEIELINFHRNRCCMGKKVPSIKKKSHI